MATSVTFYLTKSLADANVLNMGSITDTTASGSVVFSEGTARTWSSYKPYITSSDSDVQAGTVHGYEVLKTIDFEVHFKSNGVHEFYIVAYLDKDNTIAWYYTKLRYTVSTPDIPVSSVSLSPSSQTLEAGTSGSITVTIAPSNATYKSISWTSSNTDVATLVSNITTPTDTTATNGVRAKSEGVATITATSVSGVSATAIVTVTPAITRYTVYIRAFLYGTIDGESTAYVDVPAGTSFTTSGNKLTLNGTTYTAIPNSGYRFSYWTPSSGTINGTTTITAYFSSDTPTPTYYTIRAWIYRGSGTLTVTDANGNVHTTSSTSEVTWSVPEGSVLVEATPAENYEFETVYVGTTGSQSAQGHDVPYGFTINANKDIFPSFTYNPPAPTKPRVYIYNREGGTVQLAVDSTGEVLATVGSGESLESFNLEPSVKYRMTATASSGYYFYGYTTGPSQEPSGVVNPFRFTTSGTNAYAYYANWGTTPPKYLFKMTSNPGGYVVVSIPGFETKTIPENESYEWPEVTGGTIINMQAYPNEGLVFKDWGSGSPAEGATDNPRNLPLNSNTRLTAGWVVAPRTFYTIGCVRGGTVTLVIDEETYEIDSERNWTGFINVGKTVTVTAHPGEGTSFKFWGEGSSGNYDVISEDNPYVFEVENSNPRSLTAIWGVQFTATALTGGSLRVRSSAGLEDTVPENSSKTFPADAQTVIFILEALPKEGFAVRNWYDENGNVVTSGVSQQGTVCQTFIYGPGIKRTIEFYEPDVKQITMYTNRYYNRFLLIPASTFTGSIPGLELTIDPSEGYLCATGTPTEIGSYYLTSTYTQGGTTYEYKARVSVQGLIPEEDPWDSLEGRGIKDRCYLTRYDSENSLGTSLTLPNVQSIEETDSAMLSEISTIIYGYYNNFVMDLGTVQKYSIVIKRVQPENVLDDTNFDHQLRWSNGHWFTMLKKFTNVWQNLTWGNIIKDGHTMRARTGGFEFHFAPCSQIGTDLYPEIDRIVFIGGAMTTSFSRNPQIMTVTIPLSVGTMVRSEQMPGSHMVLFDPGADGAQLGLSAFQSTFPEGLRFVAPMIPKKWIMGASGLAFGHWTGIYGDYTVGSFVDAEEDRLVASWAWPMERPIMVSETTYLVINSSADVPEGVPTVYLSQEIISRAKTMRMWLVGAGGTGGLAQSDFIGGSEVYGGGGGSGGFLLKTMSAPFDANSMPDAILLKVGKGAFGSTPEDKLTSVDVIYGDLMDNMGEATGGGDGTKGTSSILGTNDGSPGIGGLPDGAPGEGYRGSYVPATEDISILWDIDEPPLWLPSTAGEGGDGGIANHNTSTGSAGKDGVIVIAFYEEEI